VCGRLTAVAGASDVLRGGVVSYASDVKYEVLGVTPGPVVSEAAAIEMARGVCAAVGSDVGLALTGVAGPTEQDGMPVGTLCVGLALADGTTRATTARLPGLRQSMRELSVITALDFLRRHLP
jgi:nicotinamide-nucleotide amidase